MSKGRYLHAGDMALTDYNSNGMTRVMIVERKAPAISGSGILFRVSPSLKGGTENSWYDADWFEPEPPNANK